jgi:hypothetical protein
MDVRFPGLMGAIALATSSLLVSGSAIAQEAQPEFVAVPPDTVADAYNRAFFQHDVDFVNNRYLPEQFDVLFGIGGLDDSFVENEINQDASALYDLYRDTMYQQAHSTPLVRTADVTNPYDTSLLLSPNIPREPVPPAPARIYPVPYDAPAAPRQPIPALY